jgi:hypothetical protein
MSGVDCRCVLPHAYLMPATAAVPQYFNTVQPAACSTAAANCCNHLLLATNCLLNQLPATMMSCCGCQQFSVVPCWWSPMQPTQSGL